MSNKKRRIKLTPKTDICFKHLFGIEGKEERLRDFLEAILDIEIKRLELGKDTILHSEESDGKMGILDVYAVLDDGTKVNIEMQNKYQYGTDQRTFFYLNKIYLKGLKKGIKYYEMPKSVVIFIADHIIFKNLKKYHNIWKMTDQEEKAEVLDGQEMHFIELPKFRNSKPDFNKKIEAWLAFIDYKRKEWVEMACEKYERIKETKEEFEQMDEEELYWLEFHKMKAEMDYNTNMEYYKQKGLEAGMKKGMKKGLEKGMEKGHKKGMEEGIREGRAEGRAEGAKECSIEIAKRMLKMELKIEQIVEVTGLSKEEINELKN